MLVITVPQNGTRLCLRVRGNNKHYLISSKEGRTPKNWCLRTVVLEKALESLLDSKEIKPVNPEGNQAWILVERTDWCWSWSSSILVIWCKQPTHWESPWCWERLRRRLKMASQDEMPKWHHWCNGHELGQTSGDGEGQGGLVCCSPWGHKVSDRAGGLNNNHNIYWELSVKY